MNVMGTRMKNEPPLAAILSALEPDTAVTIEIDGCATAFVVRISTRRDVLRTCQKCADAHGSHPRVREIGVREDYMGPRLLLRCD